jgi:chromosome segregation ATPase
MGDIYVENYKKAVERAVDRWSAKIAKVKPRLDAIRTELQELEEIEEPSDDDKKQIAALKKEREECKKAIEKANMELKLDLMLLELDKKANEKEALKLPPWLKDIVKKGGIPLSDSVTLVPDASFDLKAKKLKSFSLTLKWEF